jgi:hypothetical protein
MRHFLRHTWFKLRALVVVGLVFTGSQSTPAILRAQTPPDIGYRDFSFTSDGVTAPTGQKPQSKLWFNDGLWWGSLFNITTDGYNIYRFDRDANRWTDTGTVIDLRNGAHMDCLWDGTYLYVASAGTNAVDSNDGARIWRFSYDATSKTYSLTLGFPVPLTAGGMEALVLAKDTAGLLWVTFTRDRTVYIMHSTVDERTWLAPSILPFDEARNLTDDDISTVVAFGSQIGVLWSDQRADVVYLAVHDDGDEYNQWALEHVTEGHKVADDHLNVLADSQGQLYAAVKTSLNDSGGGGPDSPLVLLIVRDLQGQWASYPFGTVADDHTRPIVLVAEDDRMVYVFAAAPCCSGGAIYYKQSSLDAISFPGGLGTPFMRSSANANLNNPTSTKQPLNSATGLLVIASDYHSGFYFHNAIDFASYCTVSSEVDVNLRSGPGTDYARVGNLEDEQAGVVVAQGYEAGTRWWQLQTGEWVRSDVVTAAGACENTPTVAYH